MTTEPKDLRATIEQLVVALQHERDLYVELAPTEISTGLDAALTAGREALAGVQGDAAWVHISEDGEGQENYCKACGAEPGQSCSSADGTEWGRRVHAVRKEEPTHPQASEPAPSTAGERDAKPMTAHRAVYFMERFKREEKLLGPNEQAAIDYVIALLQSTADHIPDAGKMVAAMPVGELTLEQITRIYDRYGGDMVNCTRAIERELAAARSQPTTEESSVVAGAQPVREPLTDGPVISGYAIPVSEKRFADEILIQRSRQIEGHPLWAVRLNGNCLNKQGQWEWEPMPSSRDDEFLARCRFDSAESAIAAAHGITKKGEQ